MNDRRTSNARPGPDWTTPDAQRARREHRRRIVTLVRQMRQHHQDAMFAPNPLYDRWTQRGALVVLAEVAAYQAGLSLSLEMDLSPES